MRFLGNSDVYINNVLTQQPAAVVINSNTFSFDAYKYGSQERVILQRKNYNSYTWYARTLSDDHDVIYDHMNNFTA